MSISSFIPSFLIKPSLRSPWLSGHKTGPWHTPGLRAPPAHHLVSSPPPHLPLTHTPGPRTCLVPSGPRAFARAGTATWKMPSPSPTLGVRLEERSCSPHLLPGSRASSWLRPPVRCEPLPPASSPPGKCLPRYPAPRPCVCHPQRVPSSQHRAWCIADDH